MSVVETAGPLWLSLTLWVVVAITGAVAFSYFWRKRVRELYEGGSRRYLLALIIQATGFMAPIGPVLLALQRWAMPPGLDILIALCVGFAVVVALRMAPVTGPMLKDLYSARIAAAMERRDARS